MNFERLRRLLLQKAIEGKLVPQLDEEPPVEQIGEAPKDVPFAIPEKWKWTTIGASLQYGSSEQIIGNEIPSDGWILDLEDIEKNTGKLLIKKRGCSSTSNKAVFRKGDVLYGKLRPYLNKCIVADEDGFSTTEIVAIRTVSGSYQFDPEYIKTFLMSPIFIQYANSLSYGVKMPRLGTKDAKAAVIPVPPIEEQRRIVERLNALLATLNKAEDAYKDLQVLGDNLRAKMLQKAIEGKLVPQLDEEPPVEQIGEAPKDVPFAIPEKWKWVQLSNLVAKRSTVDPSSINADKVSLLSIPAYDAGSVEEVSPKAIGSSKKLVREGDILVSKIVPHISRAWVVPKSEWMSLASTEWMVFSTSGFFADYLRYIFTSTWFKRCMLSTVSGMGSLKRANPKQLSQTFIPVPPIAEQRRIVEKLNALLPLVDEMTA